MDLETYERAARSDYNAFARAVSMILKAAIATDANFRLVDVSYRAKSPESIKPTLQKKNCSETKDLERDISDLAGCRIIFYTNDDVSRFIESRLMLENFVVIKTKLHQANRDTGTAADLYIANHYLVELRPERLALPEYARFTGRRCEVQIQTILNHAWAEMAHDTIYKKPLLDGFGVRALKSIEDRMAKVMRKYLIPAGYAFQHIVRDFERIQCGKEIFNENYLNDIIDSEDNNKRSAALERLSKHVLPLYDDLKSEYPRILKKLTDALIKARNFPTVDIETPLGSIPGKTIADITRDIAAILETYRYVDIDGTFDALCGIFPGANSEDERKPLLELAQSLSKHDFHVWQTCGPAVQAKCVLRMNKLSTDQLTALQPLLVVMLSEILKTHASGTSSSSSAITWHSSAVTSSKDLDKIRSDAIELLKMLYDAAQADTDRRMVLDALVTATYTPTMGSYSNQLVNNIIQNTSNVIDFFLSIAPDLSYTLLQRLEEVALHSYRRFRALPSDMASDADIVESRDRMLASIRTFRDEINANRRFVIYKTLVGFDSVFPPAWENDQFDYTREEAYREERVAELGSRLITSN